MSSPQAKGMSGRSQSPMLDFRSLVNSATKGSLVTAQGDVIDGYSFGANKSVSGEIVFNTGMVGYTEALTDPSYAGQILLFTYPMIGNYGIPGNDKDESGMPKFFESDEIQVAGVIVAEYSAEYSHWNAVKSLGQWLTENGVPALYGIDTRMLTKKIREEGSILAKIEFEGDKVDITDPNKTNLVASVSTAEVKHLSLFVFTAFSVFCVPHAKPIHLN